MKQCGSLHSTMMPINQRTQWDHQISILCSPREFPRQAFQTNCNKKMTFNFGAATQPASNTAATTGSSGSGFSFNFGGGASNTTAPSSTTGTTGGTTSTGAGGFSFGAPSTGTTTTQPTTTTGTTTTQQATTAGTTGFSFGAPSTTTTGTTTGAPPTTGTTGTGFSFGATGSTGTSTTAPTTNIGFGTTTAPTTAPGGTTTTSTEITPKTPFKKLPQPIKDRLKNFEKSKITSREKAREAIKKQENSSDMSKLKRHIQKVEKKISASKVNIERTRDTVDAIKHEVLVESKNVEQAQNSFHKLGLRTPPYSNTDPNYSSTYFINTSQKLEQRMQEIWKQIEDISHTLSHSDVYNMPSGQLLQGTITSQQQAFFNAAARLSVLHEKVNEIKDQYIRIYGVKGDPFKEPAKTTKPAHNYGKSSGASLPGISETVVPQQPTTATGFGATQPTTGFGFGTTTQQPTTGFGFGTTTQQPTTGGSGFNFSSSFSSNKRRQ